MIDKIAIIGLWNERNYRINFNEGSLILVGENGSGKTTVLRIIHSVLSMNWISLYDEDFQRIELESEMDRICIKISDLQDIEDYYVSISRDFQDRLPNLIINKLINYCGELTSPERIKEACQSHQIPEPFVATIMNIANEKQNKLSPKLQEINEWIAKHNDMPIIYLPTYRRSEKYVQQTINTAYRPRRNRRQDNSFFDLEVAKEGMEDVDETIIRIISDIKYKYIESSSDLNINCFKGILTREYKSIKVPEDEYMNPDYISEIFNSMSNTGVLTENMAKLEKQLLQLLEKNGPKDDYDEIVIYYYQMMIDRYKRLKEAEEPLEAFFFACNRYLSGKTIKYYPNLFKYEIVLSSSVEGNKRTIDLNHLSSGEKQLVSLFNYVYLSSSNKCMVIIDEPELSLSADWQEHILEDVKESGRCGAIIAATQSPFIFDNSLKSLAKPIDLFLSAE